MKNYRKLIASTFGGIALFLMLLGCAILWRGGFGQLVAFVNGESVYISPKTLNLGSFEAGKETIAVFHLTNLTSQDVSVVGERSSCNCAFSEKIPITAASGKTVELKINIHLPKYDSAYDQTVTFMIAEPKRLAMYPVRITATIPNPLLQPVVNPESDDEE
jgi:hypothetical protein